MEDQYSTICSGELHMDEPGIDIDALIWNRLFICIPDTGFGNGTDHIGASFPDYNALPVIPAAMIVTMMMMFRLVCKRRMKALRNGFRIRYVEKK
ncbi:hypothetical protein I4U23_002118 [Adineta vaga]|nr:hypothetical protein I4U23_002118 [Adineta vaga]